MNKVEKVTKLVDSIEKNLRALAKETGDSYISLCLIDGSFNLDNGCNGFDVYRNEKFRDFTYGGKKYE